ncbi:hypothetical protein [Micromonospora antibiotica]|uniref:DUF4231 domain-containing protein n=1 Tax=Micromonospora antibiotica TaxID=2807623 RepID=A0ABS3V1S7_9ACTN|nr:hypothetical protein [Micromonospora antibiotica]MBO4159561.1 hypothetical protein [Micromonospora antibiotica]
MSKDKNENVDPLSSNLTPAASELLSSYLASTRDRILNEIEHTRATDGIEGSIRKDDLAEAIRRISAADARTHYLGKLRGMRRNLFYQVIKVGFICTTIIVFVINMERVQGNSFPWLQFILGGAAFIAGETLYEIIDFQFKSRRARRTNGSKLFLELISKVEINARKFVAREIGMASAEGPLGIILAVMRDKNIWSDDEINNFRLLMRIRNSLVHENSKTLSDEQLRVALSQLQRLSDRIPGPRIPWPVRSRAVTTS